MKLFYLVIVGILASKALALDLENLSQNERWLRLLHYRSPMIGTRASIIDNGTFFLSKEGDDDAAQELKATIDAFASFEYDKNKFQWHPQCAFPARLKFLKQNTDLKFPDVKCEDFEWWKKRVSAKGISLVFSSYYKGNPASMFGHTLLKLNTDKGEGKISDFTFNFAANVGPDKGLTYIVKGLTGGFDGVFSTEPYYVKINDYVQGESRDVWEYLLDVSDDDVDWVVRHIWELKTNAIFDYFFLDENCSYILLAVLDVARLDWNTSRGFYYYTLPVTTIKRVEQEGAIKEVFYRPSFRKKMMERVRILSPEQKTEYFQILDNKEKLLESKDKKVVEAYIAYLRFKQYEEGDDGVFIKSIKADLRKGLIHRARLGGKTPQIDKAIEEQNLFDDPRKGHDSYTMTYSLGNTNHEGTFHDFTFRFGVHDLLNNGLGLPRYSNIEVLSFKGRFYQEAEKFYLQELIFVDMLTLIDYDSITKESSWGIRVGLERPRDFNNKEPLLRARPVYGYSKYLLKSNLNLYSLLLADIQAGPMSVDQDFRLGPGLQLGVISYLSDNLKFMLKVEGIYDFLGKLKSKMRGNAGAAFNYSFGPNWETRLEYDLFSISEESNDDFNDESKFSMIYFF